MADRPPAEVEVDEHLVRSLLAHQAPAFTGEPLRRLGQGWDNSNWRLGTDHVVRIPVREIASPLIRTEHRWLPDIARRVDLAVPEPVILGEPDERAGYPWPWAIVRWIDGTEAASVSIDTRATATTFGRFLAQLHSDAPDEAPENPWRGGPLQDRQDAFERNLDSLSDAEVAGARGDLRRLFERGLEQPHAARSVWLHGDLHTRNMIVADDQLVGIIDWSDLCRGDPATDLAAAWMLCPDHLEDVIATAAIDAPTRHRAAAWVVHFAVIYLAFGDDDPTMRRIGEGLLAALFATE